MVDRIEQYADILKVYLKPTKEYPDGAYFYCNGVDEDLIYRFRWFLNNNKVKAQPYNTIYFHKEIVDADKVLHRNRVIFDNIRSNLVAGDNQSKSYQEFHVGYNRTYKGFQANIKVDGYQRSSGVVHSELEACQLQYYLETEFLKTKVDNYYMYDFLLDRRNSVEILDLERTGKISKEEAVYKHVLKHANAWHYFRFGLQEYFRENKIPVPLYGVDEKGFLVDKITGKRLCPEV